VNIDELLDPELAPVVAQFGGDGGIASLGEIPTLRAQQWSLDGVELSDAVERTDQLVPGGPGDPDVALRVHRPRDAEGPLPCIYSIHGGGYISGTHDTDDLRFDELSPRLGVVGVSVGYRLAPETPYPGPLEDCYAGLVWTVEHAGELGIDPERIGISGFSAGGGLAAALALLSRDRGGPSIAFQQLVYPMLDDRQRTVSSQWAVPIWPPGTNRIGWQAYLGDLHGSGDVPYHAAPSQATDLSGLPPAFIGVGALDGFVDEDIDYAQRLSHAGVPTELHVYPGAPHGFDAMSPDAEIARRARRHQREWLVRHLGA
jgi:acetyl esterase/lipase